MRLEGVLCILIKSGYVKDCLLQIAHVWKFIMIDSKTCKSKMCVRFVEF